MREHNVYNFAIVFLSTCTFLTLSRELLHHSLMCESGASHMFRVSPQSIVPSILELAATYYSATVPGTFTLLHFHLILSMWLYLSFTSRCLWGQSAPLIDVFIPISCTFHDILWLFNKCLLNEHRINSFSIKAVLITLSSAYCWHNMLV
jgi:hypothetical protein